MNVNEYRDLGPFVRPATADSLWTVAKRAFVRGTKLYYRPIVAVWEWLCALGNAGTVVVGQIPLVTMRIASLPVGRARAARDESLMRMAAVERLTEIFAQFDRELEGDDGSVDREAISNLRHVLLSAFSAPVTRELSASLRGPMMAVAIKSIERRAIGASAHALFGAPRTMTTGIRHWVAVREAGETTVIGRPLRTELPIVACQDEPPPWFGLKIEGLRQRRMEQEDVTVAA